MPITNTFIQLAGDGDRLQISNMSEVEVVVEVKIVGVMLVVQFV